MGSVESKHVKLAKHHVFLRYQDLGVLAIFFSERNTLKQSPVHQNVECLTSITAV